MTTSRKFATSPDVLVAKGKIKSQMRLYWSQLRALCSLFFCLRAMVITVDSLTTMDFL